MRFSFDFIHQSNAFPITDTARKAEAKMMGKRALILDDFYCCCWCCCWI